MRQIALLLLSPFVAGAALGITSLYSSPSELWSSIQPLNTEVRVVNTGAGREEDVVRTISDKLPDAIASRPVANQDCFQDLARADTAKLDRCAGVVYQALAEVERQSRQPVVRTALASKDRAKVVEQLKYAAVEVCRTVWASAKTTDLAKSPACGIAEIRVALDGP